MDRAQSGIPSTSSGQYIPDHAADHFALFHTTFPCRFAPKSLLAYIVTVRLNPKESPMNKPQFTTTIKMDLRDRASIDVLRNLRAEKNGGRRPTMQAVIEEAIQQFLATQITRPSTSRISP